MAKKLRKKIHKKNKYSVGGTMYDTNTIPVGLQTKNLVAEESNPQVLANKEKALEAEKASLATNASNAVNTIEENQEIADQNIEAAAAASEGQADAIVNTAKTLGDKFVKPQDRTNPFSSAVEAYKGVKTANLAAKATQFDASIGMNVLKKGATDQLIKNAPKGASFASDAITGKTIVTSASGEVLKQGSSIGAGLKNFATSGAGIGTIASLAGAGVSKVADDKDATTLTLGEGSGKVLSGIGTGLGAAALTGMALGSAVPVLGNIVGGVLGAGYGLFKGLAGRNKARKLQAEQQKEEDAFVSKTNTSTGKRFGSQLSSVQAAKLKAKTFSGYNQGFNTLQAKMGGLKLGMPRY